MCLGRPSLPAKRCAPVDDNNPFAVPSRPSLFGQLPGRVVKDRKESETNEFFGRDISGLKSINNDVFTGFSTPGRLSLSARTPGRVPKKTIEKASDNDDKDVVGASVGRSCLAATTPHRVVKEVTWMDASSVFGETSGNDNGAGPVSVGRFSLAACTPHRVPKKVAQTENPKRMASDMDCFNVGRFSLAACTPHRVPKKVAQTENPKRMASDMDSFNVGRFSLAACTPHRVPTKESQTEKPNTDRKLKDDIKTETSGNPVNPALRLFASRDFPSSGKLSLSAMTPQRVRKINKVVEGCEVENLENSQKVFMNRNV